MSPAPLGILWKTPVTFEDGGRRAILLEFTLCGKLLAPADLLDIHLPDLAPPGSRSVTGLVLGGKGPLWLYAELAGQALDREWPWIAIYDPRFRGGVTVARQAVQGEEPGLGEVFPCGLAPEVPAATYGPEPAKCPGAREESLSGEIRLMLGRETPGTWVYRLAAPGSGTSLRPGDLSRLIAKLPVPSSPGASPEIQMLWGPFPVWLSSALVLALISRWPKSAVAIYDPKLSGAVVVHEGKPARFPLGLLIPNRKPDAPVPMVALIGDPNSGKSVLSWKLYWALQRRELAVYRHDCDASAPTTGWSQAKPLGPVLRNRYKQQRGEWKPGDESGFAAQIGRLKESGLDVVLLDMPGGIHKRDQTPIRIPPGREALFRPVDGFIVLARNEAALTGWTEALEAWNLESRIVAIVEPRADTAEEETIPDGNDEGPAVRRWRIHGLDRGLYEMSTPGVEALADWLVGKRPWEAGLSQSGRRPGSGSPPTGSLS